MLGGMSEKVRENRLREAAKRQGFRLAKSRRRDRLATDYGWYIMRGKRQLAHFRELDSVERWLREPLRRDTRRG